MAEETFPTPSRESEKREYPEIKELKERIEQIESQLKKEKISEEKEKIVKQEIKSYLQGLQQTPTFAPPPTTRDQADEIKELEHSQQIGVLISLVFEKNLPEAISVAQQLNNPAILDEFHDTLIDRYYEMLLDKKILKF